MSTPTLDNITPISPAGHDVDDTIRFYEQVLGFSTLVKQGTPTQMAVIQRGAVQIMLVLNADKHLADNTAFRIKTTNVVSLYQEINSRYPAAIHPNGRLDKKPWGSTEFSVLDPVGVCIAFYEFPSASPAPQ